MKPILNFCPVSYIILELIYIFKIIHKVTNPLRKMLGNHTVLLIVRAVKDREFL